MEKNTKNENRNKDDTEDNNKRNIINLNLNQNNLFKEDVKTDPYVNANIFSKLSFYWVFNIFKKTSKFNFGKDSFKEVEKDNKCEVNYNNFKYYWDKSHKLLYSLFKTNLVNLIITSILTVIVEGSSVLNSLVYREYIGTFTSKNIPTIPKVWLAISYIILKLIICFLSKQCLTLTTFRTSRIVVQLISYFYSKNLRLSCNYTEGELVIYSQIDIMRIAIFTEYIIQVFICPILIIIYSTIIFKILGLSYIFGFGILLLIIIFNFFLQYKSGILQNKLMIKKDERMLITSEALFNLKSIKLYNLEDEFINKIEVKRDIEIGVLNSTYNYSSISTTIMISCPVILSVSTVFGYKYFSDIFIQKNIFFCIYIFSLLSEQIRNLPVMINRIFEGLASIKRMENFLNENEINNQNTIINSNSNDVEIINGNFLWDSKVDKAVIKKNLILNDRIKSQKQIYPEIKSKNLNERYFLNKSEKEEILLSSQLNINESSKDEFYQYSKQLNSDDKNKTYNIKNINLQIEKNKLIIIIGSSGSGKSSLFHCFLNNLKYEANTQIQIQDSLSYYSQSVWLQTTTIKNNILFESEYDEQKYNKVVEVCQLKTDFEMFLDGDQTEIGGNGTNLSGGQKARIGLARAVYANKDLILLDDPIAALDNIVAGKIMKYCFCEYLKNKTRVIITHNTSFLHLADRIIFMEKGEIEWMGNYSEIKTSHIYNKIDELTFENKNKDLTQEEDNIIFNNANNSSNKHDNKLDYENNIDIAIYNESNINNELKYQESEINETKKENIFLNSYNKNNLNNDYNNQDASYNNSKIDNINNNLLLKTEDRERGAVNISVYKEYINKMGGYWVLSLLILVTVGWQILSIFSNLWFSKWTKSSKIDEEIYKLYIYAGLALGSSIFVLFRNMIIFAGAIHCTKCLHKEMITKLLKASINLFHDTIPNGQIINRLSNDLTNTEGYLLSRYSLVIMFTFSCIGTLVNCGIFEPITLIFAPILVILCFVLTRLYMKSSRELYRLETTITSEVINNITELKSGLYIIRAFKHENLFLKKFFAKVDTFMKVKIYSIGLAQWFGLYMDLLSISFMIFIFVLSYILEDSFALSEIALIINFANSLQMNAFTLFSMLGSLENCMVYMERCLQYTRIQTEIQNDKNLVYLCMEDWPNKGEVEFKNISARYRPGTAVVLKNLKIKINALERIGVVGRTGSGKSSLALTLFKMIELIEGNIEIDGINIDSVNLSKIRSSLAMIPQVNLFFYYFFRNQVLFLVL